MARSTHRPRLPHPSASSRRGLAPPCARSRPRPRAVVLALAMHPALPKGVVVPAPPGGPGFQPAVRALEAQNRVRVLDRGASSPSASSGGRRRSSLRPGCGQPPGSAREGAAAENPRTGAGPSSTPACRTRLGGDGRRGGPMCTRPSRANCISAIDRMPIISRPRRCSRRDHRGLRERRVDHWRQAPKLLLEARRDLEGAAVDGRRPRRSRTRACRAVSPGGRPSEIACRYVRSAITRSLVVRGVEVLGRRVDARRLGGVGSGDSSARLIASVAAS